MQNLRLSKFGFTGDHPQAKDIVRPIQVDGDGDYYGSLPHALVVGMTVYSFTRDAERVKHGDKDSFIVDCEGMVDLLVGFIRKQWRAHQPFLRGVARTLDDVETWAAQARARPNSVDWSGSLWAAAEVLQV